MPGWSVASLHINKLKGQQYPLLNPNLAYYSLDDAHLPEIFQHFYKQKPLKLPHFTPPSGPVKET